MCLADSRVHDTNGGCQGFWWLCTSDELIHPISLIDDPFAGKYLRKGAWCPKLCEVVKHSKGTSKLCRSRSHQNDMSLGKR